MSDNVSVEKSKASSIYELVKEGEDEREDIRKKFEKKSRGFVSGVIYYGLPLLSIAIFMGITFAGTVPAVKKGILNRMDEIEERETEIEDLDRQISDLVALKASEPQIQSDLNVIERIAPTGKTQVAKFVGEIADLAEKSKLEENEYASGESLEEIQQRIEKKSQEETAAIIHVPAQSNYNAKFEEIQSFLLDLYNKDDFIIVSMLDTSGGEARQFYASLQKQQGLDVTINTGIDINTWTMEVVFEKFQFSVGFDDYLKENLVPVDTEPNEVTLKYIRKRFSN